MKSPIQFDQKMLNLFASVYADNPENINKAIVALHNNGYGAMQIIYSIRHNLNISLKESQELFDQSKVWDNFS